ncbi:hypothetical protein MRX96_026911 [Rhipicephalus microplus]
MKAARRRDTPAATAAASPASEQAERDEARFSSKERSSTPKKGKNERKALPSPLVEPMQHRGSRLWIQRRKGGRKRPREEVKGTRGGTTVGRSDRSAGIFQAARLRL